MQNQRPFHPNDNLVHGFLTILTFQKSSKTPKYTKRRYVILIASGQLIFYKNSTLSDPNQTPKGHLQLTPTSFVSVIDSKFEDTGRQKPSFKVGVADGEHLILEADNERIVENWIAKLKAVILKLQGKNRRRQSMFLGREEQEVMTPTEEEIMMEHGFEMRDDMVPPIPSLPPLSKLSPLTPMSPYELSNVKPYPHPHLSNFQSASLSALETQSGMGMHMNGNGTVNRTWSIQSRRQEPTSPAHKRSMMINPPSRTVSMHYSNAARPPQLQSPTSRDFSNQYRPPPVQYPPQYPYQQQPFYHAQQHPQQQQQIPPSSPTMSEYSMKSYVSNGGTEYVFYHPSQRSIPPKSPLPYSPVQSAPLHYSPLQHSPLHRSPSTSTENLFGGSPPVSPRPSNVRPQVNTRRISTISTSSSSHSLNSAMSERSRSSWYRPNFPNSLPPSTPLPPTPNSPAMMSQSQLPSSLSPVTGTIADRRKSMIDNPSIPPPVAPPSVSLPPLPALPVSSLRINTNPPHRYNPNAPPNSLPPASPLPPPSSIPPPSALPPPSSLPPPPLSALPPVPDSRGQNTTLHSDALANPELIARLEEKLLLLQSLNSTRKGSSASTVSDPMLRNASMSSISNSSGKGTASSSVDLLVTAPPGPTLRKQSSGSIESDATFFIRKTSIDSQNTLFEGQNMTAEHTNVIQVESIAEHDEESKQSTPERSSNNVPVGLGLLNTKDNSNDGNHSMPTFRMNDSLMNEDFEDMNGAFRQLNVSMEPLIETAEVATTEELSVDSSESDVDIDLENERPLSKTLEMIIGFNDDSDDEGGENELHLDVEPTPNLELESLSESPEMELSKDPQIELVNPGAVDKMVTGSVDAPIMEVQKDTVEKDKGPAVEQLTGDIPKEVTTKTETEEFTTKEQNVVHDSVAKLIPVGKDNSNQEQLLLVEAKPTNFTAETTIFEDKAIETTSSFVNTIGTSTSPVAANLDNSLIPPISRDSPMSEELQPCPAATSPVESVTKIESPTVVEMPNHTEMTVIEQQQSSAESSPKIEEPRPSETAVAPPIQAAADAVTKVEPPTVSEVPIHTEMTVLEQQQPSAESRLKIEDPRTSETAVAPPIQAAADAVTKVEPPAASEVPNHTEMTVIEQPASHSEPHNDNVESKQPVKVSSPTESHDGEQSIQQLENSKVMVSESMENSKVESPQPDYIDSEKVQGTDSGDKTTADATEPAKATDAEIPDSTVPCNPSQSELKSLPESENMIPAAKNTANEKSESVTSTTIPHENSKSSSLSAHAEITAMDKSDSLTTTKTMQSDKEVSPVWSASLPAMSSTSGKSKPHPPVLTRSPFGSSSSLNTISPTPKPASKRESIARANTAGRVKMLAHLFEKGMK